MALATKSAPAVTAQAPFCQGSDWFPRSSTKIPGTCGACGKALTGRNHWFCPSRNGVAMREAHDQSCRSRYLQNHHWGYARAAAIKRDQDECQRCGESASASEELRPGVYLHRGAEVNHIVPRLGQGYGNGCHNHQDNLETLCHRCHVATTNIQRSGSPVPIPAKERRRRAREKNDLDKLTRWTGAT